MGDALLGRLDDCFSIAGLRFVAKRHLPRGLSEFIDKGVEDHIGPQYNRDEFRSLKLKHKVLVDVSNVDLGTELFGKQVDLPFAVSPTGTAGLCWYEGEIELAKAAAKMGVPLALATAAINPMERVAKEAGGRLWFQVMIWEDRELTYTQIRRAQSAGFEALIITVDYGISSNRSHNVRKRGSPRARS